jgi:hypothetical protein
LTISPDAGRAHLALTISTSGRIFGGYSPIPFKSTSGTQYPTSLDYTAFTFRRNPGNPADNFESLYDYSGNARTADNVNWGPCWSWAYYGSNQYQPLCWTYGNMEYTYNGYYDYYTCAADYNFACGNHHYGYWTCKFLECPSPLAHFIVAGEHNPRLAQMEVWYQV